MLKTCLFVASAVALPLFRLPSELTSDVSKSSSIVNVIADAANDPEADATLHSMRQALRYSSSFLKISGDEVPPAPVVLNVGLEESGYSSFMDLSSASEASLLSDAAVAAAAAEGITVEDLNRDYSGCPSGWSNGGAGICYSPQNYGGPCGTAIDFGGLTPQEKIGLAAHCGATFSHL